MAYSSADFRNVSFGYVWDVNTLSWIPATPGTGGGGGGAGDASAANQTTEIARLTSILAELTQKTEPADQQHVIVDSSATHAVTNSNLDVALSTRLKPADTLTKVATVDTITNVVHVDDNAGSLTVDGTVALSAGAAVIGHVIADTGSTTAVTGNVTVVQPTGTNLHAVVDSGTLSTITNVVHVDDNAGNLSIDDGGNSITVDGTVALSAGSAVIGHVIADTGSTTAVTGNVTVTQGTGTNLHAVIDSGSTTAVTQATGTNLHTVVDSGTISTITNVVHVDDNAGSLTIDNTGITSIDGKVPALGQALAAGSVPVVLTAIQAASLASPTTPMVDRTASGTITTISGAVVMVPSSDSTVLATVSGTWVGTLVFLGIDGIGGGIPIGAVNASSGAIEVTTAANGTWLLASAAWPQVGIISTAWTSGTATVNLISSTGTHVVELSRSLPVGTNVIGQVTANAGTNLNTSLLATSAKQDTAQATFTSLEALERVNQADLIQAVLVELRIMNFFLREGLGVAYELDTLRLEFNNQLTTN